ncbi:MAG: cysteine--tRNA ligase [Chitinispirillia bacterium]|jgi:cysteinyl-tRNA synthetase
MLLSLKYNQKPERITKRGMALKVYNSLSRKVEEFRPLESGKVKMYACGITVYDEAHIGHASQAVFFDVIRRYLEYKGMNVNYVRNFTDIDDNIINRANETGKKASDISERFIKETRNDLTLLKVLPATKEPKVSKHISEIIQFIDQLCKKEKAYESDGNVYFRVSVFPSYGKLSNRKIDEMIDHEQAVGKESPSDFALWKKSKPNEPSWESPWGPGRPGWHIECSALVRHYIGDTLDIHGGGVDLIFPHHENEIAQSETLTGKPMAHYWIHNGLVMVENQKMSKSLGNFYTIKQALDIHVPDVIRYIILSHHYSSKIDFSLEAFRIGEKRIFYFYKSLSAIDDFLKKHSDSADGKSNTGSLGQAFIESMDENFNTAKVIADISIAFSEANSLLGKKKISDKDKLTKLHEFRIDLFKISKVLGILDEKPKDIILAIKKRFLDRNNISESQIEDKIQQRNIAKKDKDYSTADMIRNELTEKGIKLLDFQDKTDWEIQGE